MRTYKIWLRLVSVISVCLLICGAAPPVPDDVRPPVPKLVNAQNPLPSDYIPELVAAGRTGYRMTQDCYDAYTALMAAARAAGMTSLRLQSAYRSYETQRALYQRKVNALRGRYGDAAPAKAAQWVARPGTSEHQLGQALDIANGSLVQSFGKTTAGKWLADNAHRFGFILRYPEGKTDITGVVYEPWHLRYVGTEWSGEIYESGLCLEEFLEGWENGR